jgi:hypothetical protein
MEIESELSSMQADDRHTERDAWTTDLDEIF